jgi:hypothetical protein
MAQQQKRSRVSKIVVENTLTRSMYARILFLLGVRSWGFVLMVAVFLFLVWWSIVDIGDYTLLAIYAGLLILIYGGAVLVSVLAKKNRRAYSPIKYTFEESGVTKETAKVSQSFKWNSFIRWRKIGSYFLIYASKRSFFVIPESKIPKEQVGWFENLLSRNIVQKRSRLFG